ncbi:WapI family immunity protein [Mucilaginibacter sp. SJ]|uniref:WapI family immunity protein n=1 Tax=Mucilaginibacter sp. SJ TaxID=3029053 RepID=UPI00406C9FB0
MIGCKVMLRSKQVNYKAAFMLYDFSVFRDGLKLIYNDLNGVAKFVSLEKQLEIEIKGDGFGLLIADGIAMEQVGYGNELRFQLNLDQIYIPALVNQLDDIIEHLS